MRVKNVVLWTGCGALFGILFGSVAAVFQNGPAVKDGILQSWWWFSIAGFLKALTDPKNLEPDKNDAHAQL